MTEYVIKSKESGTTAITAKDGKNIVSEIEVESNGITIKFCADRNSTIHEKAMKLAMDIIGNK